MPQTNLHYDERDAEAIGQLLHKSGQGQSLRQDASVFAARQLEYVKSRTYDRKLPPMKGLQLVPPASDAPEWAETITYYQFDTVGIAKVIANYADDLPRADVSRVEKTISVKTLGSSYGYNVNELSTSVALGTNLPERKATAARRAIDIKENTIAMVGDSEYGLYGLLNHPNIGETTITGGWTASTPAATILADLQAIVTAVRVQSKGVHRVNRLALATADYSLITTMPRSDNTDTTVAKFFLDNNPGVVLEEVYELTAAGDGGGNLIIAGEFSEENMWLERPMAFNQLPAQERNLELVVNCMSRIAGVSVPYPLAFTKAEI
jgi:hypothetical protein